MAATTYKITAISKATKAALVEYEFIPEHKIDVIYNGIEPLVSTEEGRAKARQELRLKPEQRVIGTVARLDPIKNQAMILEAFSLLVPEFPDLVLLLVGDGPERQNLEQLTNKLKIDDRVIFAGFKSPATDYMALMELFLLPSLSEGTSMTLLEAMSLGIPSIVSNVGGNPEVVSCKFSGEVISDNKYDVLYSSIRVLLKMKYTDKNKYLIIKEFKKRFSCKVIVENYMSIYL